jgi:hypothetical protein
VSSINYGKLGGNPDETLPPEGLHDAYLIAARLQTGSQDFIVTEWQSGLFYWETLFGFTGGRIRFTQDALDGLGINRAKITDDDALSAALDDVRGSQFRVRVERNGNFVNTYIEGDVLGQAALASLGDAPIDTAGLPDVSAPPQTAAPPPQMALTGSGASPPTAADDDLDDIPF